MDELILQFVAAVIAHRKESGISPTHATFLDLNKHLKESLNRLYKAGKVKVGDTINDKYIDIIQ